MARHAAPEPVPDPDSVLAGPDPSHFQPMPPPIERKVAAATLASVVQSAAVAVLALVAAVVAAAGVQPQLLATVLDALSVPAAAIPAVLAVVGLLAQPAGVFWLAYRAAHTPRPDLAVPVPGDDEAAIPRADGDATGSGDLIT